MTASTAPDPELFICVQNTGYEASLERRKLYDALPDLSLRAIACGG